MADGRGDRFAMHRGLSYVTLRRCAQVVLTVVALVAMPANGARCGQAVAAAPQPATPEELFRFAPRGTWGVQAKDARQLKVAPKCFLWRQIPVGFQEATASVEFFLPPHGGWGGEPAVVHCGIVRLDGANKRDMENALAHEWTETKVEGVRAYMRERGPVAVLDDTTCLYGSDEESLAAMIRAYRDGEAAGLPARLQQVVAPFAGRARYCGVVMPESVDMTSPDGYPPRGTRAAGESYSFRGGGLSYSAMAEVGDEHEARAALAGARARIAGARAEFEAPPEGDDRVQQLAALLDGISLPARGPDVGSEVRAESDGLPKGYDYLRQYVALVDKISLSVDGPEVHVELALTDDDLAALPWRIWMTEIYNILVTQSAVNYGSPDDVWSAADFGLRSIWRIVSNHVRENGQYPAQAALLADQRQWWYEPEFFVKATDRRALQLWRGESLLTYRYAAFPLAAASMSPIICYTMPGLFPGERDVLRADGSIEWVTEEQLHDPAGPARTSLRGSYEAVLRAMGDAITDEQRAELKAFYEIKD
jgi:hypothetical protein